MIKKIVLGLFTLFVLQWASNVSLRAQPSHLCVKFASCGYYSFYNMVCVPPLPPGAASCQASPTWGLNCAVVTDQCGAPPSWCPTCAAQGGAATGAPINLTNGNTYIQQTDVRLPGLGNGITLVRTWNSMWPSSQSASRVGLFGPNWRSTYEERIIPGSGDSVNYTAYSRSDGGLWYFGSSDGGSTWSLAAPAYVVATMTKGTSAWTMTFQNGEQRLFDINSGSLTAIVDRNGNTTQLSYDGLNRLVTVTDPSSRHLYFGYGSDSSLLVTSITSDVGLTLAYAYDGQGRLILVTKPDQRTLSFQYDGNSMITAVSDSDGRILESHTYDSSGRGSTSSRAGGVEAVTLSYPNH
jgi:YD repeat-containing protein